MNSQLLSICKQKQDTTRVGFSSSEFEEAYNQHNFKEYVNNLVVQRIRNNYRRTLYRRRLCAS